MVWEGGFLLIQFDNILPLYNMVGFKYRISGKTISDSHLHCCLLLAKTFVIAESTAIVLVR